VVVCLLRARLYNVFNGIGRRPHASPKVTVGIIFKLVMSYAAIIRRIPKPRDGSNGEELPKFTTGFTATRMGNVTFSLITVM
jgi:hypothetical protein